MTLRSEHERVGEELQALRRELVDRLGLAVVSPDDDGAGLVLKPAAGACALNWMQWGDDIILGVGGGGCRWELSWTLQEAGFLRDVVEAVVDGRVTETLGLARSEVRVTLRDGTVAQTSQADAPLGCLPVPWWRRSEVRRVDYVPYG